MVVVSWPDRRPVIVPLQPEIPLRIFGVLAFSPETGIGHLAAAFGIGPSNLALHLGNTRSLDCCRCGQAKKP